MKDMKSIIVYFLLFLPSIFGLRSISRSVRSRSFSISVGGTAEAEAKAKLPLKIAVAGAGIGGVYLGYSLYNKGFDVTVFEKSAKFSRFGGPIQLASNALSCVNAQSPELFKQIMGRFTFTGTRKCGIKDGMRNSWYSVFGAIKDLAEWNTLPYTGVIDRPDLQEILLNNMKNGTVINSMKVAKYIENEGEHSCLDCFEIVVQFVNDII